MRKGDKICVLVGGGPLFVLRLDDTDVQRSTDVLGNQNDTQRHVDELECDRETFRLIGDAYVDGLVFGEAFANENLGPERYFKLA